MKKTSKKAKRALTAALAGVMMMSTAAAISASADDSVLDYDSQYFETIDEDAIAAAKYNARKDQYWSLCGTRKSINITNNGLYHAKKIKLYGRRALGVDKDGNFILGGWEQIIDNVSVHGESSLDNEITFDGTFVNFAFSFDITWGTDFPYSDVFWTDTHNTDWSTIDVELRGFCRNASIQIHVGNTRAVDKRNCDSHSEWKP